MSEESEIKIFAALNFIRDNAPAYAKAKAERVYLEEFRKSKKALCMRDAELSGHRTAAIQEREAYADPQYVAVLEALKIATEEEEKLRWLIVAAQVRCEVWRSMGANQRAEAKNL